MFARSAPYSSPMHQPKPTRYPDAHGVQRLHGRRTGFVMVSTDEKGRRRFKLYCPEGHAVDFDGLPLFANRPVRCTGKDQRGAPECGISMLLIARMRSMREDEIIMAVEVTPDEFHWMDIHHIELVPDMLEYLGMVWPRGVRR